MKLCIILHSSHNLLTFMFKINLIWIYGVFFYFCGINNNGYNILCVSKEAVSSKIIMQIKNTMSDRHAAEKAFNELLCDFRADILPTVAENWTSMTDEQ